jgi:signal transduction histidine kinase
MKIFSLIKKGADFVRDNPSIIYSLVLILVIPLCLFINIYYAVTSFQKNINTTLQTEAALIEDVIGKLISKDISDFSYLQQKVDQIQKDNSEIKNLKIYIFEEDYFKLVAGKEEEREGMPVDDEKALAWVHDEGIAHLTKRDGQRYWDITKPFWDVEGRKVGLISMSFSLAQTDALVQKTINYSYIILIIVLVVVLSLVVQHTRLFEYALLLKKLKEVDQMKDDFISIAAHELRTPLTAISGYASLLKESLADKVSSNDEKSLDRVIISAKRLDKLVEDILDVSRIEQGRLSYNLQKYDINKIVKESAEELRSEAEHKGLKLKVNLTEQPEYVRVDEEKLKQVLLNLIGNAIKYTLKGKIEVRVTSEDNQVVVDVKDTGVGMGVEEQKQLFSKFYRVKNKETSEVSGTGLGLWITKQLVEKMGGKIGAQSIKGTGSRFFVSFPKYKG